ncbi:MAG: hypothetical protein ACRYGG_10650 [Janthinobacterium lividum]
MDISRLINVAAELSGYITTQLPHGGATSYERPADGMVHIECSVGATTWWLVLTAAGDAINATVVDPDGDVIKQLFSSPQDAAAFILTQFCRAVA